MHDLLHKLCWLKVDYVAEHNIWKMQSLRILTLQTKPNLGVSLFGQKRPVNSMLTSNNALILLYPGESRKRHAACNNGAMLISRDSFHDTCAITGEK